MTNLSITSLEVMQALSSIHEAIGQINQAKIEHLNDLEIKAIQSYYLLIKHKLSEQDRKFSNLSLNDTPVTPDTSAAKGNEVSISKEHEVLQQKDINNTKAKRKKKPASHSNRVLETESSEDPIKKMFDEL
jgi:hypothetical protein